MTIYQHITPLPTGGSAVQIISFAKKVAPDNTVKQYIKIETPGERDYIERWMEEKDYQTYARQWQAYSEKGENSIIGTPLAETMMFNDAILSTLAKEKIYTLEQLAELPESLCSGIMNAREWKTRAKQVLEAREGGKEFDKLSEENKVLKEEIIELRGTVAELKALIGSSTEAIKSKAANKKTGGQKK